MRNSINTVGSTTIARTERQSFDFYQTPAYATKTLVSHFNFKTNFIWEPMAGDGMISKQLQSAGINVYSTDIIKRNFKLNDVVDYFTVNGFSVSEDDFAIVTNPPYSLANEFLKHTLEDIKPATCCVFLPVRYLEGKSRYNDVYSKYKPCKVFIYARRLGCFTEQDIAANQVTEYGVGSAVAYMWLCFDRDSWATPSTKTELEWIL